MVALDELKSLKKKFGKKTTTKRKSKNGKSSILFNFYPNNPEETTLLNIAYFLYIIP